MVAAISLSRARLSAFVLTLVCLSIWHDFSTVQHTSLMGKRYVAEYVVAGKSGAATAAPCPL